MAIDLLKQLLMSALQSKAEVLYIPAGKLPAVDNNGTRTELPAGVTTPEQLTAMVQGIAPTAIAELAANKKAKGQLNLGGPGTAEFIVHGNADGSNTLAFFLPPTGVSKASSYWDKISTTDNRAAQPANTVDKAQAAESSNLPPEAFSAVGAAKAKLSAKTVPPQTPPQTPAQTGQAEPAQVQSQPQPQAFAPRQSQATPDQHLHSFAQEQLPESVELEYAAYSKGEQTVSDGQNEIDRFLKEMIKRKASDLHLTGGQPVCLRADGDIERLPDTLLTPEYMKQLLDPIFPLRNKNEFLGQNDTDFAYEISNVGRFRVNIFRDKNGIGAVLRHIPSQILTAQQLNLSPAITSFCKLNKGLVLVTGPTGSGKSTTLAAMIDLINKSRHDHILTIEDPIEFVHQQHKSLVNQREVHRHTTSFARALKAALREDPDIVLIGEMRDLETISIAIETAETGHLVFGTLHTTTAVSTVDRIIQQFPAERQEQIRMMLAGGLRGVVAQTLLKKIGGGRVAAHEILVVNDAVSAMIREGKNHMIPNHMQTQKADGNQLLNESLLSLVLSKTVSAEDAYAKSVDKNTFGEMLKRKGIDTSAFEMKRSA